MYEIYLTPQAQKVYESVSATILKGMNRCFRQLGQNPYRHANIKKLKGKLEGHYRYRVGNWRVVYRIEVERKRVIILLIVQRKDAY